MRQCFARVRHSCRRFTVSADPSGFLDASTKFFESNKTPLSIIGIGASATFGGYLAFHANEKLFSEMSGKLVTLENKIESKLESNQKIMESKIELNQKIMQSKLESNQEFMLSKLESYQKVVEGKLDMLISRDILSIHDRLGNLEGGRVSK